MPATAKKGPLSKPKKDDDFEIEMPTNSARVPKGKYTAKLIAVEKETSASNNPMWTWTFVVVEGPYAGEELKVWTALTPAAMWKVGEVLNALGLGTEPGKQVKFSRQDAIGRMCVLNVVEEEYEGRPSSKVAAVTPHPKGAGYKKKGGPVAAVEEEDEEDEPEEDDEDELDEDEDLDDEDEEEDEDDEDLDEDEDEEEDDDDLEDEDEDEEDDEEEDDDEEDEPPPPAKKKAPAKKAAPPAKKAPTKRR